MGPIVYPEPMKKLMNAEKKGFKNFKDDFVRYAEGKESKDALINKIHTKYGIITSDPQTTDSLNAAETLYQSNYVTCKKNVKYYSALYLLFAATAAATVALIIYTNLIAGALLAGTLSLIFLGSAISKHIIVKNVKEANNISRKQLAGYTILNTIPMIENMKKNANGQNTQILVDNAIENVKSNVHSRRYPTKP